MECEAGVPVVAGWLFRHFEVAQESGIYTVLKHCLRWDEAVLAWVPAASESWNCEFLVGPQSLGLVLFEAGVVFFGVAYGFAGVPDCDAFDLVGCGLEPERGGFDDGCFDLFPTGGGARFAQGFDGLVVAPPCGVEPELNRLSLFPAGVESGLAGLLYGSGGVRGVGKRRYRGWREYPG